MDGDDRDSLNVKDDVNTVVTGPVSDDNVDKCMPKPIRNFDQEQKQIQVFLTLKLLQCI